MFGVVILLFFQKGTALCNFREDLLTLAIAQLVRASGSLGISEVAGSSPVGHIFS